MRLEANRLYHIYNQGNNKELIFLTRDNYLFFLEKVRRYLLPNCDIIAYCLMPNHFHFLIHTREDSVAELKVGSLQITNLANAFRNLLSSYAQAFNKQQSRSGSLFRQKTKMSALENSNHLYPLICFNYIHQNPMKAGLVSKMENWEFSSFADYIGNRKGTLCNQHLAVKWIDLDIETLYKESYKMISETHFYESQGLTVHNRLTLNRKIDKSTLRNTALYYRKLLSIGEYKERNDVLLTKLEGFLDQEDLKCIHLFLPISRNKEPDVFLILEKLWGKGIVTITSTTNFKAREMSHYYLDTSTKLNPNHLGIPEPVNGRPAALDNLDAILVPLVLADKAGARIGYGGGFYDKMLTETKAIKIGLSLANPVDRINQIDSWDIPLDYLITPFNIYNYG